MWAKLYRRSSVYKMNNILYLKAEDGIARDIQNHLHKYSNNINKEKLILQSRNIHLQRQQYSSKRKLSLSNVFSVTRPNPLLQFQSQSRFGGLENERLYEKNQKQITSILTISNRNLNYPSFLFYHTSSLSLGGGTPTTWGHVNNWKVKAKLKALEEKDLSNKHDGKNGKNSSSHQYDFSEDNIIRLDDNLKEGVLEEYFATLKTEMVSSDPKIKWRLHRKKINMKQLFGPNST